MATVLVRVTHDQSKLMLYIKQPRLRMTGTQESPLPFRSVLTGEGLRIPSCRDFGEVSLPQLLIRVTVCWLGDCDVPNLS